jgi:hypothetical protein
MIHLFVILQALAAVLLGAVGLFTGFRRPDGGLNRTGFLLLGGGGACYIAFAVCLQVLNDVDAARKQHRIEELLDKYFSAKAPLVMATPKGPTIPVLAAPSDAISITRPQDEAEVGPRALVEGTASSSASNVWVVVHPMDTSSYWVQPRVSVRSGGAWTGMAYLGRSGSLDVGKKFEVVALADPFDILQEGEYGNSWPRAKWTSKPVILTRR